MVCLQMQGPVNESVVQSPLLDELEVDDDPAAVDVDDGVDTGMLTSDPTGIDNTVCRICESEAKTPEQNCDPVVESMWPF
jgi:hypothetical protein